LPQRAQYPARRDTGLGDTVMIDFSLCLNVSSVFSVVNLFMGLRKFVWVKTHSALQPVAMTSG
jgi:hypothetical protein